MPQSKLSHKLICPCGLNLRVYRFPLHCSCGRVWDLVNGCPIEIRRGKPVARKGRRKG